MPLGVFGARQALESVVHGAAGPPAQQRHRAEQEHGDHADPSLDDI
jgi:hypothetical protein